MTNTWTNLLANVRLKEEPEHVRLVVLGGTPQTQIQILKQYKRGKNSAVSNTFGLGYGYFDIDLEGSKIGQVEAYTLNNSYFRLQDNHPAAIELLERAIAKDHQKQVVYILVDWTEIDQWAQQLQFWTDCVQKVCSTREWTGRENERIEQAIKTTTGRTELEKSQFSMRMGIEIIFACTTAERSLLDISDQQREHAEQFVRSVAYSMGASVISTENEVQVPSSAAVDAMCKALDVSFEGDEVQFAPQTVDTSHVAIPRGWDSLGKILSLHEAFPVEKVCECWASNRLEAQTLYTECLESIDRAASHRSVDVIGSLYDVTSGQHSSAEPGSGVCERIDLQAFLRKQYENARHT